MTARKTLQTVLGPRSALLIASDAQADVVEAAKKAVLDGAPLSALMSALTERGLSVTPDFACVVQDAATTRLVLRGPYLARVEGLEETYEEFSGEGVATWLERLLPADVIVELFSGDHAVRVPLRDPAFPLTDDVATAGKLATDLALEAPPTMALRVTADPEPPVTLTAEPPIVSGAHTETSWQTTPSTPPVTAMAEEPDPFQHMLEHTIHFGVEAAAVRPAEDLPEQTFVSPPWPVAAPVPPPPPPPPPPLAAPAPAAAALIDMVPPLGGRPTTPPPAAPTPSPAEADAGLTISRAEMLRLAGEAGQPSSANGAPKLQAVHCPMGHSSAPTDEMCRSCGSHIVDRSVSWVARPILARLSFGDGFVHAVHRPVLMGRAPTAEAYTGGEDPQLLPLPDPEQMLSRTHAEIRLVDWQVQIIDRGSLNGTVVTLPGREPQQLRPREPFLLSRGAQVALGGVVTFNYQESET